MTSSFVCSIFRPFNFHIAKGQNFSLQVHHVKPLGTEWRRSVGSFFVCPFWTPAQRPVMKISWFSISEFLKKEITHKFFFCKIVRFIPSPLHPSPSPSPPTHSPPNFATQRDHMVLKRGINTAKMAPLPLRLELAISFEASSNLRWHNIREFGTRKDVYNRYAVEQDQIFQTCTCTGCLDAWMSGYLDACHPAICTPIIFSLKLLLLHRLKGNLLLQ